jgi:aryl-alcohol dehydrogenase-like predicted oxidoreductase
MRDVKDFPSFADAAQAYFDRSLAALKRESVEILLLHASEDLWRPSVVECLEREQTRGRFREFGVSVYDSDEAVECLADSRVKHLQLPLNLLDRRWFGAPFEPAIAKRSDVKVHVRSAFLQGLLLNEPELWPEWVRDAHEIDRILSAASRQLEGGRIELCLRYIASVPWVNHIVVGVDSAAQLREILRASRLDPLSSELVAYLDRAACLTPARLLNPSLW